jgi:hypothetical protein
VQPLPVDHVSRYTTLAALEPLPNVVQSVLHVTAQPPPTFNNILSSLAEYGFPTQRCEYLVWRRKLEQHVMEVQDNTFPPSFISSPMTYRTAQRPLGVTPLTRRQCFGRKGSHVLAPFRGEVPHMTSGSRPLTAAYIASAQQVVATVNPWFHHQSCRLEWHLMTLDGQRTLYQIINTM